MDPISNADRLVRALRQKLEERAKAKGASSAAAKQAVERRGAGAVRNITGRLAQSGVEEEQLQRALVEQLLADQFGPELVNEPKFQEVVDKVCDIMQTDRAIAVMMGQALAEIRR